MPQYMQWKNELIQANTHSNIQLENNWIYRHTPNEQVTTGAVESARQTNVNKMKWFET